MAIGSLIVFVPKQPKSDAASFAGLASILTAILTFNDNFPDPSYYTLLPTCGTALVILYSSETKIAMILSNSHFVTVGLISYSAYLIHQPLFAFYRIQSMRLLNTNDFIVLIMVTLLLSYLTWRFVENPFRDKNKVSLNILICVFASCAFFLFLLSITVNSRSSSSKYSFTDYNLTGQGQFNDANYSKTSLNRYIAVNSETTIPQTYDSSQCHLHHLNKKEEKNPLFCRIGSDMFKLPPTYFLTGDSMSLHYAPAFDDIPGSGVFASIGDNCQTTLIRPGSAKINFKTSGGFRCWLFHEHVFNYIKNYATSIRKVFLVSHWFKKLDESSHLDLIYAIKQYATINVTVYLIEQPPVQPFSPIGVYENLRRLNILTNATLRAKSLSISQLLDYDVKKYQPFLKRMQESGPFFHIKTRNYFCDDECCPIGTTNLNYYIDEIHIHAFRAVVLRQLLSSIV
jgi:hypothetical protein